MSLKQTPGILLIALYCTIMPQVTIAQAYYRNDRLEQRHPQHDRYHQRYDHRNDAYRYDRDRYREDHDRSRHHTYHRKQCNRKFNDKYRRHRHRGLLNIILRI